MDTVGQAVRTPEMEWVNCPLCESDESDSLYTLRDYYTRRPGLFTLVRCLRCGLVYLNPRPTVDAIAIYYPPTYESYMPLLLKNLPLPRRWLVEYGLWKRCRPLLVDGSLGKVLDVGCGTGHFLAAMRKHGKWKTVGIDRDPQAVTFAREVLNLEVHVGRIEENDFPERTFDAVTMWDTLEHFHNPREVLLEIRRILKPGGRLLLRVPSLDSLDARLFGRYWAGLDAPRHLTVFSKETLARLLARTGFVVERLWCLSGSHASFVISSCFLLEHQRETGRLRRLLHRAVASPAGSILSAPYFFVIDKLLLGSEITVLSRKQGEGK
jgi:SAM-dependent methyltransferase